MRFMKDEEAVSPVIGVILMVAITVILAAVIAVFVFGLAGDLESGAQKDVQLTTGTNSDGNVTVTVFSGADVSKLATINASQAGGNQTLVFADPSIGDTKVTTYEKINGEVIFSGHFDDGTSQVLGKSS